MTPIRPLERDDLSAVAALYAEFVGWDPVATTPRLAEFFAGVLFDHPFADPEIPSLVYDDKRDGVVGFIGSHPRPFVHGEREVRLAYSGPLIVEPAHRPRGVGALLLRAYLAGPQDITVSDRAIDQVHAMWERLGGVTDTGASIGWAIALAPAGFVAGALARRTPGRTRLPGDALLSRVDALTARRFAPAPPAGTIEPLANAALLELMPQLGRQFELVPAYDDAYLTWLFRTMEDANVGDRLVRRLVRDDGGRPAGAYVMYVTARWTAHLIQVAAAEDDVPLVLDHLMHDAAAHGAVEVRGRFERHLLQYLQTRRCRLTHGDWAVVKAEDPVLRATMLSGRAFVTRLDGEWWMRPRGPEGP